LWAACCGQCTLGALPPDEGAAQLERWRTGLAALVAGDGSAALAAPSPHKIAADVPAASAARVAEWLARCSPRRGRKF